MASSSSSPVAPLEAPVAEKLTRENYILWKAQFLPAMRGAQLMGILHGSIKEPAKIMELVKADDKKEVANPEYDSWVAKDQQLLSYLLNSITKEVLAQVAAETTSARAWKALQIMFVVQLRARVTNLRMRLSTLKKGSMISSTYFTKMVVMKNELAVVGILIDDGEMASHILNGLDFEYNPLTMKVDSTRPLQIQQVVELLEDAAVDLMAETVVAVASKAEAAPMAHTSPSKVAQVAKLFVRSVKRYRYEEDDQQNIKTAAGAITTHYGFEPNWYADRGAIDHITSELDKLTVKDKYNG
nr:uncharacterized protein LOC117864620 [Setaria viridis]